MIKTNWKSYLAVFTLKTILALLLLLFLVWLNLGCARVSYRNEEGGEFSYIGFGKQIQGFEAHIKSDHKIIKLNKTKNSMGELAEAINNITKILPVLP